MSAPFSLREAVRAVLTSTNLADPGEIADAVLGDLAPADYRAALEQTMRLFVRQVISEQRGTGGAPANVRPIRPSSSWKGAAIREGWQRHLRDRIHVDGTWKMLAACTADDLRIAAAERQQKAEQNAAWAHRYRAFADALDAEGVARFADLRVETQMHLLGGAA